MILTSWSDENDQRLKVVDKFAVVDHPFSLDCCLKDWKERFRTIGVRARRKLERNSKSGSWSRQENVKTFLQDG